MRVYSGVRATVGLETDRIRSEKYGRMRQRRYGGISRPHYLHPSFLHTAFLFLPPVFIPPFFTLGISGCVVYLACVHILVFVFIPLFLRWVCSALRVRSCSVYFPFRGSMPGLHETGLYISAASDSCYTLFFHRVSSLRGSLRALRLWGSLYGVLHFTIS